MMKRFFPLFLLLAACPVPAQAYTQVIDLFVDQGVNSLMRGGMKSLPDEAERLDFRSPLLLDSRGKYRIDSAYEHQRTVRVFNGRWGGSHAFSDTFDSAAAAPFSLLEQKITGTLAVGYGLDHFDFSAQSSHAGDLQATSNDTFAAVKGGFHLNLLDRLKLGASVVSTDYRGGLEVPVQAELAVTEALAVGYRRSYIDLANNITLTRSGTTGELPVRFGEEVHEVSLTGRYRGVYGTFTNELGNTENRAAEGRIELPLSLYLVGEYRHRDLDFFETFTVSNRPGGYLRARLAFRSWRAGIGMAPSAGWKVEANYRHWNLSSSGGGIANSAAVVDFWPSLVIGNYNHSFDAAFSADQYHLGTTYTGERFTFGGGAQYVRLNTGAQLDYWRSVIFGLGTAGAGNVNLDTDRVNLLFLSLGLGYRWRHVALNYAFGQFIPLSSHDSSAPPPSAAGGGGGGRNIFSSIVDKIDHNPGGNMQRILVTVTF